MNESEILEALKQTREAIENLVARRTPRIRMHQAHGGRLEHERPFFLTLSCGAVSITLMVRTGPLPLGAEKAVAEANQALSKLMEVFNEGT